MTTSTSRRLLRTLALIAAVTSQACQASPDADAPATDQPDAEVMAAPEQPVPEAEAPAPAPDTLELVLAVDEPACAPGVCVCRGSTERSTGLWGVGLADRELTEGVRCIAADFDANGTLDLALLGGEGWMVAVMYDETGPTTAVEIDAAGYPDLYEPRATEGPGGEPASETPGIFVPNVGGGNHSVFLWDGTGFARTLYPRS